MLMVPEKDLALFSDVLRKTGAEITQHDRDYWHNRPVFQGMYMGKLLWGTLEGTVIQIQCDDPDILNSLSELWAVTLREVQALAQGEKDGSISKTSGSGVCEEGGEGTEAGHENRDSNVGDRRV